MRSRLPSLVGSLALAVAAGCGTMYLEPDVSAESGPTVEVVPPEELAFGPVSPSGSPEIREATIRATGGGRVAVESVVVSPDGDGTFTLASDPSPCLVEAHEEALVEVRFHPSAVGSYAGRLTITASVSGEALELSRRLAGSGCNDPDRDGQCANGLPGFDPADPGDTGE